MATAMDGVSAFANEAMKPPSLRIACSPSGCIKTSGGYADGWMSTTKGEPLMYTSFNLMRSFAEPCTRGVK